MGICVVIEKYDDVARRSQQSHVAGEAYVARTVVVTHVQDVVERVDDEPCPRVGRRVDDDDLIGE